mgnify:CR=1 FL=1
MLSCKDLLAISAVARMAGEKSLYFYAVALLALKGYGRVAISKKLGIREREARKILEALRLNQHALNLVKEFGRVVLSAAGLECKPVVYTGLAEDVLSIVESRVVLFRDYLVINSRNPEKVEVIGTCRSGSLKLPGVPEDVAYRYRCLEEFSKSTHGVLVCWKSYEEVADDALVLLSLSELCKHSAQP